MEGKQEMARVNERGKKGKREKNRSSSSESGRVEAVLFSVQPFCATPLTSPGFNPFPVWYIATGFISSRLILI